MTSGTLDREQKRTANPPPGAETGDSASKIAGSLLLTAGAAMLMGIITAEALFPVHYSTSEDTISALGSTWNPGGIVRQPSATIFNATMLVTGAVIAVAASFVYRLSKRKALSVALGLVGVSVLLVGVFQGEEVNGQPSAAGVHPVVSMVAFVSGAAAALFASRATRGPFRYFSLAVGLIVVAALLLQSPLGDTRLGRGGLEQWVAYPVILWLVAFGGHLLACRPGDLSPPARRAHSDAPQGDAAGSERSARVTQRPSS